MKWILLFLVVITSAPCIAQVQKYVLTTGTNGYVTITQTPLLPQDYTRGTLAAQFTVQATGDTTMSLMYTNGLSFSMFIPNVIDTNWQNGDASNTNFPTNDSLTHWVHNHLNKYVGN